MHVTIKHLCGVRIGKMTFRDDAMRVTGLVGESLKPLRFVDGIWNAERRLDVDRLRHVREADLGDIVFDPIVLRLDRVDVAEEAMDRVRLQPGIAQLGTLHVVQVKVGVDEGYFGHGGVPSQHGLSPSQPLSIPLPGSERLVGAIHNRASSLAQHAKPAKNMLARFDDVSI